MTKGSTFETSKTRFFLIFLSSCLCSGIIPGAPMYMEMFIESGVFSSYCPSLNATSAGPPRCDEQASLMAYCYSLTEAVALFSILPAGVIFDKYGAVVIGIVGAVVLLVGLVLIQIAMFGAQSGNDAHTAPVMPLGIVVCDLGMLLNSECMFGFIFHIDGFQCRCASAFMTTIMITGGIPVCLQWVESLTGCSPAMAFSGQIVLTLIGLVLCVFVTPTREEFARYAGIAKEHMSLTNPYPWTAGFRIIGKSWKNHFFFLGMVFYTTYYLVYISVVNQFGSALFGHLADGPKLGKVWVEWNTFGAPIFTVLLGCLGDAVVNKSKRGREQGVFLTGMVLCSLLGLLTTCNDTWLSQNLACAAMLVQMGCFGIFIIKQTILFSDPRAFATTYGTITTILSPCFVPIFVLSVQHISAENFALKAFQQVYSWILIPTLVLQVVALIKFYAIDEMPKAPIYLSEDKATPLLQS